MAFKEHGYIEAARLELISLIYGPTTWLTLGSDERAAALHLLGQASLEDDQLAGALDAWGLLVDEYPDSQLAASVKEKIAEIAFDVDRQLLDLVSSAEATHYFEIADTWLEATEYKTPSIDSSYIPDEEAALDWLSLTIERFPGTSHAEIAYERMIEYRLGKRHKRQEINVPQMRPGQSFESYDAEIDSYLSERSHNRAREVAHEVAHSEEVFRDFEDAFPNSEKLQRLRYLIGQAHWLGGDLEKAKFWLSKVIEEDQDVNTFYRDLAFRRLQYLTPSLENAETDD